ncbi:MAG: methyltransferase domain-containing protein [Proteobacteria bacterium]|nr:methyltransferase domain-containing protein [Pseudomonadota bacterium]
MLARFAQQYQQSQERAMLEIERNVCGCDYGSTSWTTQDEADEASAFLELAPGKRLLDLGAGSGWPGLYLARRSGCDVTLADIPVEGLQIAARRAAADRLSGEAWIVVSDGANLPFDDGSFDAIEHSDVLCCLEAKISVLTECRRAICSAGRMLFSVISIAPSLSPAAYERAVATGPPFKAVSSDYPGMLARTGWRVLRHIDVTAAYAAAVTKRLEEEEANATVLIEILDEAGFAETIVRRRRTAQAINDGLLRREVFAALAAG